MCLAQASEDLLIRSQNVPYMLARQQVERLAREVDVLRREVETHKYVSKNLVFYSQTLVFSRTTYESLVSHVPQLLGMIHGSGGLPTGLSNPQPHPTLKTQTFVLGYGWDYPALREKLTHGQFEWWSQKQWEKHGLKGKQGQHETELNIGQLFIEGEDGDVVDGYTAKDCRDVTWALIWSLVWSGQAPSTEGQLSHEARVHIHVMLAR